MREQRHRPDAPAGADAGQVEQQEAADAEGRRPISARASGSPVPHSAPSATIGRPSRRSRLKTTRSGPARPTISASAAGPRTVSRPTTIRETPASSSGGRDAPSTDPGVDPEGQAQSRATRDTRAGRGGCRRWRRGRRGRGRAGRGRRGRRGPGRSGRDPRARCCGAADNGRGRRRPRGRPGRALRSRTGITRMDMVGMAPRETIRSWSTSGSPAGGWPARPLPASWAAEGHAMRRAIAADFASLPRCPRGHHPRRAPARRARPLDGRPGRPGRGDGPVRARSRPRPIIPRSSPPRPAGSWPIAPGRSNGPAAARSARSPAAIELTGDKLRLGAHLAGRGIATPACRRVVPSLGLPADFPYPAVLKPIDGAGSLETYLIPDAGALPRCGPDLGRGPAPAACPRRADERELPGRADGRARLIAAGRQRVEVREGPVRLSRRDELPAAGRLADALPRGPSSRSPDSAGSSGWTSCSDEGSGRATVLEINPRPTTSYVGLSWHLRPACSPVPGSTASREFPGRAAPISPSSSDSRAPARPSRPTARSTLGGSRA